MTFDAEHADRPTDPSVHEAIVDVLAQEGVSATFFLQGRWVQAHPTLARDLPGAGHLVGSHSYYHARMPLLSPAGFDNDVRRAERVIADTAGVDPRPWFRLPFGSGSGRPAIHRRLAALGYRHVPWHVDAREWRVRVSARTVEDELVEAALRHGDGAIVLLHSWPRRSLAILPGVVRRLREAGAEFVRVDQLAGNRGPMASQAAPGS